MTIDGGSTHDISLDEAVRAHRDWLVRRLALVVGDAEEAQDLAQETFARAAARWPIPDPGGIRRWLATVVCASPSTSGAVAVGGGSSRSVNTKRPGR